MLPENGKNELKFNCGKSFDLSKIRGGLKKADVGENLYDIFNAIDSDGNGILTTEEAGLFSFALQITAGKDKNLSKEEKDTLKMYLGLDLNSDFSIEEFLSNFENITDSKEGYSKDGSHIIQTTYKDGSIETYVFYPDGELRSKELKTPKKNQNGTDNTTSGSQYDTKKEYSQRAKDEIFNNNIDWLDNYLRTNIKTIHDYRNSKDRGFLSKSAERIRDVFTKNDLETMAANMRADLYYIGSMCGGREDEYYQKLTGHSFDAQKAEEFQETYVKYHNALYMKQKTDELNKGLQLLKESVHKDDLARQGVNVGNRNKTTDEIFAEIFNKYCAGDEELATKLMHDIAGDVTGKKMLTSEKMLEVAKKLQQITTQMYNDSLDGETWKDLQKRYQEDYKYMYGTEDYTENIQNEIQTIEGIAGLEKIAIITITQILLAALTGGGSAAVEGAAGAAAAGGRAAGGRIMAKVMASSAVKELTAKYGEAAVMKLIQQAMKFLMLTGTVAEDIGIGFLDAASSENGVTWEKSKDILAQSKSSAKYIYFGGYISGPVAQFVGRNIKSAGAVAKAFKGGTKTTSGAITKTSISANKFFSAMQNNSALNPINILAKGAELGTEIGAFALLDLATEDIGVKDALEGSADMQVKLKIMNRVLETLLGGAIHKIQTGSLPKMPKLDAEIDKAMQNKALKGLNIVENKTPSGTTYSVEIDGKPELITKDANTLMIHLTERIMRTMDLAKLTQIIKEEEAAFEASEETNLKASEKEVFGVSEEPISKTDSSSSSIELNSIEDIYNKFKNKITEDELDNIKAAIETLNIDSPEFNIMVNKLLENKNNIVKTDSKEDISSVLWSIMGIQDIAGENINAIFKMISNQATKGENVDNISKFIENIGNHNNPEFFKKLEKTVNITNKLQDKINISDPEFIEYADFISKNSPAIQDMLIQNPEFLKAYQAIGEILPEESVNLIFNNFNSKVETNDYMAISRYKEDHHTMLDNPELFENSELVNYLSNQKLEAPCTVYRGEGWGFVDTIKVGDKTLGQILRENSNLSEAERSNLVEQLKNTDITQPHVMSTSLSKRVSQGEIFGSEIIWNFTLEKGTEASCIDMIARDSKYVDEAEVLVQKGAKIEVTGLEFKDGKWEIQAKVSTDRQKTNTTPTYEQGKKSRTELEADYKNLSRKTDRGLSQTLMQSQIDRLIDSNADIEYVKELIAMTFVDRNGNTQYRFNMNDIETLVNIDKATLCRLKDIKGPNNNPLLLATEIELLSKFERTNDALELLNIQIKSGKNIKRMSTPRVIELLNNGYDVKSIKDLFEIKKENGDTLLSSDDVCKLATLGQTDKIVELLNIRGVDKYGREETIPIDKIEKYLDSDIDNLKEIVNHEYDTRIGKRKFQYRMEEILTLSEFKSKDVIDMRQTAYDRNLFIFDSYSLCKSLKTMQKFGTEIDPKHFFDMYEYYLNLTDKNGKRIFNGRDGRMNDVDVLSYMASLPEVSKEATAVRMLTSLVQDGQVGAHVLKYLPQEGHINPLIAEDVRLFYEAYLNNIPLNDVLVPKVKSMTDATNFKTGNVFEIDGDKNIYFKKQDGTSVQLQMDKATYCKLFPPIERYATTQNAIGNCWQITGFNGLIRDPVERLSVLETIKQDGEDIVIRFQNGLLDEIRFTNGELPKGADSRFYSEGALGINLLEYSQGLELQKKAIDNTIAELNNAIKRATTDIERQSLTDLLIDFTKKQNTLSLKRDTNGKRKLIYDESTEKDFASTTFRNGGNTHEVWNLLGYKNSKRINFSENDCRDFISNPKNFEENIVGWASAGKGELNVNVTKGIVSGHAYWIRPNIDEGGKIINYELFNPWGILETTLTENEVLNMGMCIYVAQRK